MEKLNSEIEMMCATEIQKIISLAAVVSHGTLPEKDDVAAINIRHGLSVADATAMVKDKSEGMFLKNPCC